MISKQFYRLALSFAVASAAMAGQQAVPSPAAPAAGLVNASSTTSVSPQLQQRYPRYIIQRQDVLLVSFPLSPELNQTVTVQPDGFVNLQSAGSVHVQGMTVPEMAEAVKQSYAGTLREPIVSIDLQDFQKPYFTVTGQVSKPGQFDLRQDITVSEAIAVAGGLMPTAKTQVFVFHKASNEWYQVNKLNLHKIMNGKDITEDTVLRPGDMVYVPEKFITNFRKYVPYSISFGTYLDRALAF